MSISSRTFEEFTLSELFNHGRHEINSRWEERMQAEGDLGREHFRTHLGDSVSGILDMLERVLAQSRGERRLRITSPRADAGSRAGNMISAYTQLQEVIFEVIERERPLAREDRDTILAFIHALMRDATAEAERERNGREAEASLRLDELRRWYAEVLDLIPTPLIVVASATSEVVLSNKSASELAGGFPRVLPADSQNKYFATDANGKRILLDDMPRLRAALGERLRDYRLDWHSPGSIVRLLVNSETIPAMFGKPARTIVLFQDVTRVQQMEAGLRECDQRFRLLTEAMPQLVFALNAEGRPTYFNKQWLDYTGETPAQALNDWTGSLAQKKSFVMEQRLKKADGTYRWHLVRALPVFSDDGVLREWCGTCTDIDSQKRALEELQAERELRERFVFTLTHDLRTPLTAVKARAQLMRRNPEWSRGSEEMLDRLIADVDRADKMIRDLLDANRIRAGQTLPLLIEACDLATIAQETLRGLSAIYEDRFELDCQKDLTGYWSSLDLRRVIENLASNAVKYGCPKSKITISITSEQRQVKLSVHNSGNPLAPDEQRGVFQSFHRTPSAVSSARKGWGIGLTLVRGIVEAHGGLVNVESSMEQGTTFTVVLPLDARGATVSD